MSLCLSHHRGGGWHGVLKGSYPPGVLNGYVPRLQVGGQVVQFVARHLGYPIPSPAIMEKLSRPSAVLGRGKALRFVLRPEHLRGHLMSFDLTRLRINAFISRRKHTTATTGPRTAKAVFYTKATDRLQRPVRSVDRSPARGELGHAPTTFDRHAHTYTKSARGGKQPGSSNNCELVPTKPSLGLSTLGNPDDAGRPCRQRDPKVFAICPRLGAEEHLA